MRGSHSYQSALKMGAAAVAAVSVFIASPNAFARNPTGQMDDNWQCEEKAPGEWSCIEAQEHPLSEQRPEQMSRQMPRQINPSLHEQLTASETVIDPIQEAQQGIRGLPSPYRPTSRDPFDPREEKIWSQADEPAVSNFDIESNQQANHQGRRGSSPRRTSNEITLPASELPAYLQLAFKPTRPTPIDQLPGHFWTVQLVAVSQVEKLQRLVKDNNLHGLIGAKLNKDNQDYFALLLGVYETKQLAQQAANLRPDSLQKYQPWIRSLKSVQALMLAPSVKPGTGIADQAVPDLRASKVPPKKQENIAGG